MGAPRSESAAPDSHATLRREAMVPLPSASRRPCALIGMSLVMVFCAATIDAFFWQQTAERDELRSAVTSSQIHAEMLSAENDELRQEMARMRLEQLSEQARVMQYCLRDPFDPNDESCQQFALEDSEQRTLHRAEVERLVNGDY